MIKSKYFSILAIVILVQTFTSGQTSDYLFYCGHDHVLQINEANYPGYKERVVNTFNHALENRDFFGSRNEVFRIPVVVHIVWKNNEENLHDSIVLSQIKVLNETYRLQNEDRINIRDIFKDLQSDAKIEFDLKEIKRVKTNSNFALSLTGLPDNVKKTSNGGSNALDTERHLNIWVCKIQPIPFIGGQILGYAYPPAGLPNWPTEAIAPSKDLEGVVIDFRVFGLNNPNILTVNGLTHQSNARTAVHEVGHYLGLRHIWGDGGGLFGGNSCNEDDGIKDTPNQGAQTSGGCNKTLNTCTDPGGNDLPDMIENYMDYSGEACQNTFTKEQVELMRSVLRNQRALLSKTENEFAKETIKIWPNPFTDQFNLNLNNIRKVSLHLRNVQGAVVLSKKVEDGDFFETTDLPPGLYFLTVSDENRNHVIKLIKANE